MHEVAILGQNVAESFAAQETYRIPRKSSNRTLVDESAVLIEVYGSYHDALATEATGSQQMLFAMTVDVPAKINSSTGDTSLTGHIGVGRPHSSPPILETNDGSIAAAHRTTANFWDKQAARQCHQVIMGQGLMSMIAEAGRKRPADLVLMWRTRPTGKSQNSAAALENRHCAIFLIVGRIAEVAAYRRKVNAR